VRGPSIDDLAQRLPAIAIHLWAIWGAHDVPMDRSIQAIAGRFVGRVYFVSCNVDLEENVELCRRCRVMNVLALGILVAGMPRRPIIGFRDPELLAFEIESRLRDPASTHWWELCMRRDA
jgi:hypothetical protein